MDISTLVTLDNKALQRKFLDLTDHPAIADADWRAHVNQLLWEILATEETKSEIVYLPLFKKRYLVDDLQELEAKVDRLEDAAERIISINTLDERWSDWVKVARNTLVEKNEFEENFYFKLKSELTSAERAQMAGEYERCLSPLHGRVA
ncbi:MAG: hypothetical protein KDD22_03830 [Bdellovibrionales bacterium]|nr:hypothetical protein [Bdellovibrionales bacterium]